MCLTVSVPHFVTLNAMIWFIYFFWGHTFFLPCSDLYRLLLCYSVFPCLQGFGLKEECDGLGFFMWFSEFRDLNFYFFCVCYWYCFSFSLPWISSPFSCLFLVLFHHFLRSSLVSLLVCLAFCGCLPCFDWSHLCLVNPSLFLSSPQPPPLLRSSSVLVFVLRNLFTWVSLPLFSTYIQFLHQFSLHFPHIGAKIFILAVVSCVWVSQSLILWQRVQSTRQTFFVVVVLFSFLFSLFTTSYHLYNYLLWCLWYFWFSLRFLPPPQINEGNGI